MVKYTRNNVLLRDDFTCQYCGDNHAKSTDELTLDHVVPRAHGGKTSWTNIVSACKPCNHGKGDNKKIVPKRMPTKPSYYELMAKRMKYPLIIKDESWLLYLQWPEKLIEKRS